MKDKRTVVTPAQLTPAISATRQWVEDFVVKFNLCPFAATPLRRGRIRFVECPASDWEAMVEHFLTEAALLVEHPASELSTTLIVYPNALSDFYDFLDFKVAVLDLSGRAELSDILQYADFHPDYIFAEVPENDPANATNRSPYPTLHLLRVDEMSQAIDNYPDVENIPQRNIDLLRKMAQDQ